MIAQTANAKEAFLEAVEIAATGERRAFLDRRCGDDSAMRREVEELLAHHDAAGVFLASQTRDMETKSIGDGTVIDGVDATIGPYRLMEKIGEGGFGLVFAAQQQQPVRRLVALKVIKPGMDTRDIVARFEQERQALALMDHPNIATVLDAGETPSGRPYFVMELVKGSPITSYCDDHRLDVRRRLALFVDLCGAVQHAHQKGIIHRDLKPSNVMITSRDGTAMVKVIDFGVAKAIARSLTDKTVYTRFAQVVGTPLYMSPEQAASDGANVDTRSDIYSLGVLLYELLTGSTPFDREQLQKVGYDEFRRILREDAPARPSTRLSTLGQAASTVSANRGTDTRRLSRALRGELDWVVMKALEKDRARRYDTAAGLGADLSRYLAHEPVVARPPTASYRLRKFVRRNRVAVSAGLVAGLILVLGVAGLAVSNVLVSREKANAVREKERGDRHLARMRKVLEEYLANASEDRRLKAAGLHDLRKSLLLSMVGVLDEFAAKEGDDQETRIDRGWALLKLANIWREVGDSEKALAGYERARDVWNTLATDYPDNPGCRIFRADCDNNRGILLTHLNQLDEAERWLRSALETREALAKQFQENAFYRSGIGAALHGLSVVERHRGNKKAERQLLEKAIVEQTAAVAADAKFLEARKFLANHHGNLAIVLTELKKPAEAATALNAARTIYEKLHAEHPEEPEYRSSIASVWINLGNLNGGSKSGTAAKAYRQAEALLEQLIAEFPAVPDYRRDLAGVAQNLGLELSESGKQKEAAAAFNKALSLREQLVKEHPKDDDYRLELGVSLLRRGAQEADAGQFAEAVALLTRSIGILEPLAERRIDDAPGLLQNALGARADALLLLGRNADAVKDFDRVLKSLDDPRRSHFRMQRAIALAHLKDHIPAAKEADEVAGEKDLPAYLLADAAAVFALCSAAVPGDAALAERYAVRAVALVKAAFEKNYQAVANEVLNDRKLDGLRSRKDFKDLTAEWNAKKKKK